MEQWRVEGWRDGPSERFKTFPQLKHQKQEEQEAEEPPGVCVDASRPAEGSSAEANAA